MQLNDSRATMYVNMGRFKSRFFSHWQKRATDQEPSYRRYIIDSGVPRQHRGSGLRRSDVEEHGRLVMGVRRRGRMLPPAAGSASRPRPTSATSYRSVQSSNLLRANMSSALSDTGVTSPTLLQGMEDDYPSTSRQLRAGNGGNYTNEDDDKPHLMNGHGLRENEKKYSSVGELPFAGRELPAGDLVNGAEAVHENHWNGGMATPDDLSYGGVPDEGRRSRPKMHHSPLVVGVVSTEADHAYGTKSPNVDRPSFKNGGVSAQEDLLDTNSSVGVVFAGSSSNAARSPPPITTTTHNSSPSIDHHDPAKNRRDYKDYLATLQTYEPGLKKRSNAVEEDLSAATRNGKNAGREETNESSFMQSLKAMERDFRPRQTTSRQYEKFPDAMERNYPRVKRTEDSTRNGLEYGKFSRDSNDQSPSIPKAHAKAVTSGFFYGHENEKAAIPSIPPAVKSRSTTTKYTQLKTSDLGYRQSPSNDTGARVERHVQENLQMAGASNPRESKPKELLKGIDDTLPTNLTKNRKAKSKVVSDFRGARGGVTKPPSSGTRDSDNSAPENNHFEDLRASLLGNGWYGPSGKKGTPTTQSSHTDEAPKLNVPVNVPRDKRTSYYKDDIEGTDDEVAFFTGHAKGSSTNPSDYTKYRHAKGSPTNPSDYTKYQSVPNEKHTQENFAGLFGDEDFDDYYEAKRLAQIQKSGQDFPFVGRAVRMPMTGFRMPRNSQVHEGHMNQFLDIGKSRQAELFY